MKKNLRYSPASPPGRGKPPSKNALLRSQQRAAKLLNALTQQEAYLQRNLQKARAEARIANQALAEARETLTKQTGPVWDYAKVCYEPDAAVAPRPSQSWAIDGVAHIAINVCFNHVRTIPHGDREAYHKLIARQFADKAFHHALTSLRII